MKKLIMSSLLFCSMMFFVADSAMAGSMGNPRPGYPHDTIIIHVQKGENGPKQCTGGHSLFLRHFGGVLPETIINITMVDWVRVDNDGDGSFDEDPIDGVDNDLDGIIDEDGLEPGAVTTALDCDSWGDGEVSLQIRDADPRKGWVTTQEWFVRLIGRPGENFAFTTFANQTVSCTAIDPGEDGIWYTGDDIVTCESGESEDWVKLASFDLAVSGCVKQVKLGGKNPTKGGGKTKFCDITEGFLVDVDEDGDGIVDMEDQFIFSVSCIDNPDTPEDETLYCPLSSMIWDIDENSTTFKAQAQIFVGHTDSAKIRKGKIKGRNNN